MKTLKAIGDRLVVWYLTIYYILKISLYRLVIGRFAPADVLYESLRPDIILKLYGAKVGKNVRITRFLVLHSIKKDFSNLTIGDDVHIGRNAFIDLMGKVTIGNRVNIGMYARVYTHFDVGHSRLVDSYPPMQGDIVIPDDTVIGSSAVLIFPFSFPGGTFVAAGSVVRGHYKKPSLLLGNPARPTLLRSIQKTGNEQDETHQYTTTNRTK